MRKVLVIAYYWPPAGGPGVQRWLKFVTYFREFGIEPVVYVPENPSYPILDASLVNEIPEGIKIITHPIKEPYRWASFFSSKKTKQISSGIIATKNQSVLEKALLWIRGNFFIPDARKNWVKPSVRFLAETLGSEKIDSIVTTGPPHSVHLIGMELKKKWQLKWTADFRDPWTSIGYHKKLQLTKSAAREHKRLEHSVLNMADQIVVTSAATKEEFALMTNVPIEVITNGYDVDVNSNQTIPLDSKFTVSHIGSLLTGRNPTNLWSVFKELLHENDHFSSVFELHLIGVVSADVLDSIYQHGLEAYVRLRNYVSHAEAIEIQRRSQVLLLVEIDSKETVGIVPGKVFEYLAAQRPVLALGPEGWDAGAIINECAAGQVFNYEEKTRLKKSILDWFAKYKNGVLRADAKNIEKYSRRALTAKMAEIV